MGQLFRARQGLGIALVTLTVVSALLGLGTPLLIREIINVALPTGDLSLLAVLAISMVALAALLQLANLAQTALSARIGEAVVGDLRIRLFKHIQRLELSFFMREDESKVRSRINSDIASMRNVVTTIGVAIVTNVAVFVATITAMVLISWELAIASFIAIPLAIWVARATGRRRDDLRHAAQELNERMDREIAEAFSADGMLLNRASGTVDSVDEQFQETADALTATETQLQLVGAGRIALIGLAFAALPAGIYWYGGYLNIVGDASLETLVAFASLQFAVMRPAMGVLNISTQLLSSKALFSRVFEMLNLPVETERTKSLPRDQSDLRLRFSDVSYAYNPSRNVLHDVNVTLHPGQFVSVVGPSGVGKSTLAKLSAGLLSPTRGGVLVGATRLTDLTYDSLARYVRLVPQDTFVHDASLRQNLSWGSGTPTEGQLAAAIRVAQLTDFVESLPEGLDTPVGSRGAMLSGGQRQRVAIARAVLAEPQLLILDESTSALDSDTERALLSAIRHEFRNRVVLLITHRPQAAAHATRVLEVRDGALVAVAHA